MFAFWSRLHDLGLLKNNNNNNKKQETGNTVCVSKGKAICDPPRDPVGSACIACIDRKQRKQPILFLYSVPSSTLSRHTVKVASVFYTVVIPMLNSLIYSLRNKDVKDTVSKLMKTKLFSH